MWIKWKMAKTNLINKFMYTWTQAKCCDGFSVDHGKLNPQESAVSLKCNQAKHDKKPKL
jgi:hypothetical protein